MMPGAPMRIAIRDDVRENTVRSYQKYNTEVKTK